MFTILPADEAKTAMLAQREGMTMPLSALVLTEADAETGYVLFRIERDTVELLCLRSRDDSLTEWLVRAALNAAANRCAVTAVCHDVAAFPLLERLGFVRDGADYTVFIPDFFNRPCHTHQN